MDTAWLSRRDRFAFWQELVDRETAPARVRSDHQDNFEACARATDLGGFKLTSFRYPSLEMRRTERFIRRSDPEVYQLALPTAGRSVVTEARRDSALTPAEFTLIHTSHPHMASHAQSPSGPGYASSITIQVPHATLPLSVDKVRRLFATPLSATDGVGELLARRLRHIAAHPDRYRAADAARLGTTTLNLVATLLAQHLDLVNTLPAHVRVAALRARADAFIEQNLDDPQLTPGAIAAAHYISIRTLHRLFQSEEATVAELIRTRRLHQCRRDLGDPGLRDRAVQEIAARWGFLDKAHFSRLFATTYGVGPRAYRDRSLPPA